MDATLRSQINSHAIPLILHGVFCTPISTRSDSARDIVLGN
jgi:hypothetical protein